MPRTIVTAITSAVLMLFILIPASSAGTRPTLVVSPSPTHVGEVLSFSGCGYGANKYIALYVDKSGVTAPAFEVWTRIDADGCFNSSSWGSTYSPSVAGTYDAFVYYKHGTGIWEPRNAKPSVEVGFEVS